MFMSVRFVRFVFFLFSGGWFYFGGVYFIMSDLFYFVDWNIVKSPTPPP